MTLIFDLMTLNAFSAVATHVTITCVKFYWNLSTMFTDITLMTDERQLLQAESIMFHLSMCCRSLVLTALIGEHVGMQLLNATEFE